MQRREVEEPTTWKNRFAEFLWQAERLHAKLDRAGVALPWTNEIKRYKKKRQAKAAEWPQSPELS
jgi:hypothetical protein